MRNGTYSVVAVILALLASVTLLADSPFKQLKPGSSEAKEALAAAQKPVDAAAMLGRTLPEVRMDNIPLSDVIDALRDTTGVNFVVNYTALETAGVERGVPITMRAVKPTLAEVLDDLLKRLAQGGLVHRADKEAIYISTKADLDQLAAFRERNAVVLAPGPNNPRIVVAEGEELYRPNVQFDRRPARLKDVLAALSAKSGVTIRADADGLAKAGVNARQVIPLVLRNPLLGDALTDALWLTGRIDELDLRMDDKVITVVPRDKPKAA